ncbi:hypothetical protein AKO1_008044 [Acrasis kona]|uniref:Uncharacterized protein n=1 Tax=Acrasis kona TaxID=1008807 RepID=A0AAW2YQI2_9EUKA
MSAKGLFVRAVTHGLITNNTTHYSPTSFVLDVANQCSIPIIGMEDPQPPSCKFILNASEQDGVSLQSIGTNMKPSRCDFINDLEIINRIKYGYTVKDPFIKAFTVNNLKRAETRVLDATAGMGRDSFVLSSFGFKMILVERNPIVYMLLKDGYERAKHQFGNVSSVIHADSINYLNHINVEDPNRPHVVYLDPMFEKHGKQRATKRSISMLRDIIDVERDNHQLSQLIEAASRVAIRKVIIKRNKSAPIHPNVKHSFVARDTRFDMIVTTDLI